MKRVSDGSFCNLRGALLAGLLVACGWCKPAASQLLPDPSDTPQTTAAPEADAPSMRGHGTLSVTYENTFVNGMLLGGPTVPIGTVRIQTIDFLADYFIADHWSLVGGIPFTSSKFEGNYANPQFVPPHCPTPSVSSFCMASPALVTPHPESAYLDDGGSHGTWADWTFGVEYHADFNGYILTPTAMAYIPSHNYTFFANAAVGQDLQRVEVGGTLAHQFDFTNLYYRIGYRRAFVERTLGVSINHNKLDAELGYFFNPKWSANVYGLGKYGGGLSAAQVMTLSKGPDGVTNFESEYWYHHDQISAHEYTVVGAGTRYEVNKRTTLSATLDRLVWGNTVFDFKYRFSLTLAYGF